jgi:methylmalonyl-CoA mutase C-terminal domain/subunit
MENTSQRRVLVAKVGLDGHDRGARVVSRALRDGGLEVIYTGRHVTPAAIARIARDEDVAVIGLSILSGAHVALTKAVMAEIDAVGIRDSVHVVVGGTIPTAAARDELLSLGVAAVFPGGTALEVLVDIVRDLATDRDAMFDEPATGG